MIRLLGNEEILNSVNKDYIIIVPSEEELYYKKKFLASSFNFTSLRRFVLESYLGKHSLVSNSQAFIMMYMAYFDVKESLKKYNNLYNLNFIKDLLNTYNEFYDYDLIDNDKTHDLNIIYDRYEKLLSNNNLINDRLIFKNVLENSEFSGNYAFLDIKQLSDNEALLIKKMSVNGNVIMSCDNYVKEKINGFEQGTQNTDMIYENGYYALNDVEEELEFVLNNISKKILEGNNYRDFLITSPDISVYEPYLSLVLEFPHTDINNNGTLTLRFVKLLSVIIKGDFSCQSFLNLLKLDLFNVDLKLLDKLDNYVYEWNLENKSFYLPFVNGKNTNSLNKLREDIINPLRFFLQNIVGQNDPKLIIKELWTYLSEIKIDEQLFNKDPEGYTNFVSVSECINDYFDKEISVTDFFKLLVCIIKGKKTKVSMIDEVTICNLNEACYHDKKFIYLIGASADVLPRSFSVDGLLCEQDIKQASLINKVNDFSKHELSLITPLLQNKNVMVSYHKLSTDLRLKSPSFYIGFNVLNIDEDLYSNDLIINRYASLLSDDKINKLILDNDLISKINSSNKHDLHFKINPVSALKLYSNNVSCSPSSIETYAKCRFYHFCQYGLRLRVKEKRLFDNREVGSLVHYVLENIIKNDIDSVSVSNLEEKVSLYAFKYLEDNDKLIDNTTRYVVNTLVRSSVMIIKNMISEQELSSFKPRYVEFRINEDSVIKPVSIDIENGSVTINGVVDRVDVYETDDKYMYRVIDYKTGGKKLRLDDILEGLNLQMLLYLLAIKENSSVLTNKKIVPSAVLYYPAIVKEKQVTRNLTEDELERTIEERLVSDGIVNRDDEVVKAMGEDELGRFVNVISRGKLNDERMFCTRELDLLLDNIKKVVTSIGNDIMSGKIDVNPVGGRVNACDFCKYSSICGFDKESDDIRKLKNYKNTEVFNMLEGDNNA